MKRSEIYCWRVAIEVKAALEHEARREGRSIGGLLEQIATEWLTARRGATDGEDEQVRQHKVAAKTFGTIEGGNPDRATTVRTAVRRRLTSRRGGSGPAI